MSARLMSGSRSVEFHREPDVALGHTVEDDLLSAAAHHPLEAVIAILADEEALLDDRREVLEAGQGFQGGSRTLTDAVTLAHERQPRGQLGIGRWRKALTDRAGHIGIDRKIAPAERRPVEERPRGEYAFETCLHPGNLLAS